MSTAALTDPLTGVLNRRGFTEALERELARARRYGRPLALAYVDVRGLKAVNDTAGHLGRRPPAVRRRTTAAGQRAGQ